MHSIPINGDFVRALHENIETVRQKRAAGELPADYAMFVNNLFKELHLVSRDAVMESVRLALDTSDGALDLAKLRIMIDFHGRDPAWTALHAAVGCSGEAGELLDLVKKVALYGKKWDSASEKHASLMLHVLEELADHRFYYQKFLNLLSITDEDVMNFSMVKLMVRYASGRYSDAQALARADKAAETPRRYMAGDVTHSAEAAALSDDEVRRFHAGVRAQREPQDAGPIETSERDAKPADIGNYGGTAE